MMTQICRRAFTASLALVAATTLTLGLTAESDTAQAAPAAVTKAAAKTKAQRALDYAKTRKGKNNYRYGAAGPSKFDCSGLTQWAYKKAGVSIPRTSGQQRSSSKTVHVSRYSARQGDLVFWGTGHVELLVRVYKSKGKWYTQTFGAGSRSSGIRYRTVSGVPHIERVKGAR